MIHPLNASGPRFIIVLTLRSPRGLVTLVVEVNTVIVNQSTASKFAIQVHTFITLAEKTDEVSQVFRFDSCSPINQPAQSKKWAP